MTVGRPTTYDPKYCKIILDRMSKGFSFESCAAPIGVHRDTLYEWCKVHDEFSDAKKKATELSRQFWEELAIKHITHTQKGKQLNSAIWIFNMKNRFGWTDKIEAKTDNINTNKITIDIDDSKL